MVLLGLVKMVQFPYVKTFPKMLTIPLSGMKFIIGDSQRLGFCSLSKF